MCVRFHLSLVQSILHVYMYLLQVYFCTNISRYLIDNNEVIRSNLELTTTLACVYMYMYMYVCLCRILNVQV